MRGLKILIFLISMFAFVACGGSKINDKEKISSEAEETDNVKGNSDSKKVFQVKSGHIVYQTTMEMTVDTWFDDYGRTQYTESTIFMFGAKTGSISYIVDGSKYDYSIGSKEGTKVSYYSAPTTDYKDVSKEDVEKYGIEKHGKETIAGKSCDVISIREPMASKVWIWEGIPMKTVTKLGKEDFVMEVSEIEIADVDAAKFVLPKDVTFKEY